MPSPVKRFRIAALIYSSATCLSKSRAMRCPATVCMQTVRGGTDFANGLVGEDLVEQFGQHGGIRCPEMDCPQTMGGADPAAGHLDRPDLQRIRMVVGKTVPRTVS